MAVLMPQQQESEERELHQYLAKVVPDIMGSASAITQIGRRGFDRSHSYAWDLLTVRLETGEELKIFLKDLGAYTRIKDGLEGMRQRREREFRTYRDLLAKSRLGAAEYYGSIWDEARGQFLVFLEYVTGMAVRYCEFEHWVSAAAWLGRFQGFFAKRLQELDTCEFLLRHDAKFFQSRAQLALSVLSELSAPLAARLAHIVDRYDPLTELMASQPRTFVHGAYTPSTILLGLHAQPTRVCPFDWELAGLGSPLFDLAYLCDGFEPARLAILLEAYRQEAVRHNVAVPEPADVEYLMNCFRVYRLMNWISQSLERNYSLADVTKLVGVAEHVSRIVC